VSRALAAVLAASLVAAAPPARAHVRLVSPVSRYGDEMKVGPCGRLGGARTDLVTTVRPGQGLEVVFDEIIDHPGYYRIAFDPAGDDDLAPPVWNGASFVNPPNVTVLADLVLSRTLPVGGPPPRTFGAAPAGGRMGGCATHGGAASAPALLALAILAMRVSRARRGTGARS
jgi:hypothetical protein